MWVSDCECRGSVDPDLNLVKLLPILTRLSMLEGWHARARLSPAASALPWATDPACTLDKRLYPACEAAWKEHADAMAGGAPRVCTANSLSRSSPYDTQTRSRAQCRCALIQGTAHKLACPA